MRMIHAATFGLLLLVPLAGCLGGSGALGDDDPTPPAGPVTGQMPTGQAARDLIESYIMTHPFRVQQTGFESFMESARTDLVAALEERGQWVVRHEYDGGVNILAIQNGTTHPDQWVVLSAHYDTVGVGVGIGPTVYGAWDDGAGTALLMELAGTLAQWEFPFTVVYAFFDGEEKGLVGSSHFVEQYFEDGTHDLVANLNTDPPGLNWPCGDEVGPFAVKVIHNEQKVQDEALPRYAWLQEAVSAALNETGVPLEVVDFTAGIPVATVAGTGIRGGSDHMSFDARDIANVYFGGVPATIVNGDPNESTAAVMTYSFHTPLDTLQQMEARCTQGSLAEGLDVHARLFAHTLSNLAEAGVPPAL